jgi:hypothetical protein
MRIFVYFGNFIKDTIISSKSNDRYILERMNS